jgi:hypothetical protein
MFLLCPSAKTLRCAFFLLTFTLPAFAQSDGASRMVNGLAVGDLNGDGEPDVAIANSNHSSVSVLLGSHDGTLTKVGHFRTGDAPMAIAIGDYNEDGKPDLAVANSLGEVSRTVSILLGTGDGHFGPPANFRTGGKHAADIKTADLNHDGHLDLVTANWGNGMISVILGNGDGTFGLPTLIRAARHQTMSVAIADLNGDGNLDLAVGHRSPKVTIYLGNGDGTFRPGGAFAAYADSWAVAVADLNHDGKLDLAVTDSGGVSVQLVILLGNGDGTFQAPIYFSGGYATQNIAIGDLNGDGNLDVVTADETNYTGKPLWIHLGNGDGTFQDGIGYAALTNLTGLALADFNQDGIVDIAITDLWDGGVGILLGRGDGAFRDVVFFKG